MWTQKRLTTRVSGLLAPCAAAAPSTSTIESATSSTFMEHLSLVERRLTLRTSLGRGVGGARIATSSNERRPEAASLCRPEPGGSAVGVAVLLDADEGAGQVDAKVVAAGEADRLVDVVPAALGEDVCRPGPRAARRSAPPACRRLPRRLRLRRRRPRRGARRARLHIGRSRPPAVQAGVGGPD